MVNRPGERGYWMNHLDYGRTEIALVNSYSRPSSDRDGQSATGSGAESPVDSTSK